MSEIVSDHVKSEPTGLEAEEHKAAAGRQRAFAKPRTIFHAIESSGLPHSEKTPARLAQEGLTVLFAGGETGSRVLANTVYHLLANAEVLEKVKGEVFAAAAGSNKLPDVKELEKLPWLVRSPRIRFRMGSYTTATG